MSVIPISALGAGAAAPDQEPLGLNGLSPGILARIRSYLPKPEALVNSCRMQHQAYLEANYTEIANMLGIQEDAGGPVFRLRQAQAKWKEMCTVVANAHPILNFAEVKPEEIRDKYQEIYDRDFLKLANEVAQQLHCPDFPNVESARTWWKHPSNQSILKEIDDMSLTMRGLYVLPAEVADLTGLVSLNLMFNRLSTLPTELKLCTKIRRLDLNSNRFSSIPPVVRQLTDLRHLNLAANPGFIPLPPNIEKRLVPGKDDALIERLRAAGRVLQGGGAGAGALGF